MDHSADVAAIGRVITDIETGFNTNDAERSVAHFTDDATAVSVAGTLVAGRDALLDAHRAGFAGPLRDQRARYELGEITFLRPDVAVAHKRAWAIDDAGEPLDVGHAMIALYVFVRDGGRWRVAARQNTLVRP
jgi:uncharacterized protein (TIGR02246 family)